jgi:hypothetical protein
MFRGNKDMNAGKAIQRILKRKKQDKNRKINESEIKDFLSNDFIERLIRVEQRAAASFNQYIPYNKTRYYQELSKQEKERFERYLIKKKRKRFILPAVLGAFVLSLIFFVRGITGNVVGRSSGGSYFVGTFILGLICVVIVLKLFSHRRKNKIMEPIKIYERLMLKKR